MKMFTVLSLLPIGLMTFASFTADAQPTSDRTIHSFSVNRSGGGDLQTVIVRNNAGQIVGKTVHCQFRALTPAQQRQTEFLLSGDDAVAAAAILDDQAELAEVTRLLPMLATGTWLTLAVDYSYMDYGSWKTLETTAELRYPMVLVSGQVSPVIANVETAARAANKAVCN